MGLPSFPSPFAADDGLFDAYSRAVVGAVERVAPAVVSIDVSHRGSEARRSRAQAGTGSGFVFAGDGPILTFYAVERRRIRDAPGRPGMRRRSDRQDPTLTSPWCGSAPGALPSSSAIHAGCGPASWDRRQPHGFQHSVSAGWSARSAGRCGRSRGVIEHHPDAALNPGKSGRASGGQRRPGRRREHPSPAARGSASQCRSAP
jgi:hypothetical protein